MVSVVCPAYNAAAYLDDCLHSVRTQTSSNLEILVVNDGSSDETRNIILQHAKADSRVSLLEHPQITNRGVSASRELAVQNASGMWLAFIDADDQWHAEKLKKQLALLEATDAILCHTHIEIIGDAQSEAAQKIQSFFNGFSPTSAYDALRQYDLLQSNYICNPSVIARRDIVQTELQGFQQAFQTEDWLLWVRCAAHGSFVLIPEPLTFYRFHSASATSAVIENRARQRLSFIEFYLTVIANVKSWRVRFRASILIEKQLRGLLLHYSPHKARGKKHLGWQLLRIGSAIVFPIKKLCMKSKRQK